MGNSGAVNVLKVADLALAGKIAYARGNKEAAFDLLSKAVAAEDATSYNEPSDWDLARSRVLRRRVAGQWRLRQG